MKKLKYKILGIIVFCLSLNGCSNNDTSINVDEIIKSSETIASEKLEQYENTDDFVLTFWNDALENSYIEQVFKEMYPKATINVVKIDGGDSEKISEALTLGKAPDIVMQYSNDFGKFNAMDGFEDLSQPKYNFEDIKPLFSQKELEQCMSFDRKKLIALPFSPAAMVTYYRTDILEQHGISTDPKQLGDLMESSQGWLTLANNLKKDNIYALQWKDEFIKMTLAGQGYFDKDMNLIVDNKEVEKSVETSKEAYTSGLVNKQDLWSEDGKKAIKDGKIAMLYMHKWGEDYIKEVAPETAGKWRATRLPLGISSYSGTNNISISSSSNYKMQAFKLVKKLMENDRSYYKSIENEENEFLGGQKSKLLYEDLGNKLPQIYPTMLDNKVNSIFIDSIEEYINSNIDTKADNAIAETKVKINNSINIEQKALLEYIK